jgi:phage recombination protein Bet
MSNEVVPIARPGQLSRFTPDQVELIKRTICRGASDDELQLFLYQCNRTRLDPFARQIYSVERREKRGNDWVKVRSTQVSIDGFRLIALRSAQYAGQTGPEWCGPDGVWHDVWLSPRPPVAARVGVLRRDFTEPCYGVARFEAYAQRGREGEPTRMWATMPDVMIAKCAECLALRRAFPQDLADIYAPEELHQAEQPVDTVRPRVAPLPAPPGPVERLQPQVIPVPIGGTDKSNWVAWGSDLVAQLQLTDDLAEVANWQTFNQAALERCELESPAVYKRLLANIKAAEERLEAAIPEADFLEPEPVE